MLCQEAFSKYPVFFQAQSCSHDPETAGSVSASAPPAEGLVARFEGECCVCMEEQVMERSFFVFSGVFFSLVVLHFRNAFPDLGA